MGINSPIFCTVRLPMSCPNFVISVSPNVEHLGVFSALNTMMIPDVQDENELSELLVDVLEYAG